MKTETLEAIGAAGNKATLTAVATTLWAWMTSNEFLGFSGFLIAIAGLVVTWYYKREANKRQAAESALRMERERLRIGLMRATGQPCKVDAESDLIPLGGDD